MFYANAAGRIYGLNVVRADFGSGLICPRAQKNRMVYENAAGRIYGLKCGSCIIWQRNDLPPGFNMLRAEIQRALRRAPRQLRGLRLGLQTRRGSNHSAA